MRSVAISLGPCDVSLTKTSRRRLPFAPQTRTTGQVAERGGRLPLAVTAALPHQFLRKAPIGAFFCEAVSTQ